MAENDKQKFTGTDVKSIIRDIHNDFSECCTTQESKLLRKVIEKVLQKYPDKKLDVFTR